MKINKKIIFSAIATILIQPIVKPCAFIRPSAKTRVETIKLKNYIKIGSYKKILGYNPRIEDIPLNTKRSWLSKMLGFKEKRALIINSGFGLDPSYYKSDFPNNRKRITVCPTFKNLSKGYIDHLKIGQIQDMETSIYTDVKIYNAQYKKVDEIGHSRGGSVSVYKLDAYENPQKYMSTWKKFGFIKTNNLGNKIPDMEIINKLKGIRGKTFLEKPLLDTNIALDKMLGTNSCRSNGIFAKTGKFCSGIGSYLFGTTSLAKKDQPINMLAQLVKNGKGKNLDIHTTFASYDCDVGNMHDIKLKNLSKKAGWTTSKVPEYHGEINFTKRLYNNYITTGKIGINLKKAPTRGTILRAYKYKYAQSFNHFNISFKNLKKDIDQFYSNDEQNCDI